MKRTICGVMAVFLLLLFGHACAKSRKKVNPERFGSAECRRDTEIRSSCLSSGVTVRQNVNRVSKIDLLFVVDNSRSMGPVQAKLRDQISRAIKVLTTGDKTPDDGVENRDFEPVKDLHLAVVSSDMGLPGLESEENPDATGACNGTGDDGRFLNDPSEAIAAGLDCPGNGDGYPLFLEQIREILEDPNTSLRRAEQTAKSFACMTTLGTSGCGFQMPLEAALKALWPAQKANLSEEQRLLDISFLAGSQGRGDGDHREFLRGMPYHPTEADKLSLLVITIVTDNDDCSAGAQGDLQFLSLDFPEGSLRDHELRCYKDTIENWGNKYPVSRYVDGFKALRPNFPDLVIFSAIVGIPADIGEYDVGDDSNLLGPQAYYDQILSHPDMQETPDPVSSNLDHSCIHQDLKTGEIDTRAFPARRIVEVAKGFGTNGNLVSICSDDYTPWMDPIMHIVSNKIGGICLPRALTRNSNGKVGCDIVWTTSEGFDCTDYDFLSAPKDGRARLDESGRTRCIVDQIPVIDPNATDPAEALDLNYKTGLGWYYDDFSADMKRICKTTEQVKTQQRISFTLHPATRGQNEDPPSGTSIDLECFDQMAIWPELHQANNPEMEMIGKPCETESSGMLCPPPSAEPGELFCNERSQLCSLGCRDDDDCPTEWICPDFEGAYCINPICEIEEGKALNCGNSDVGEKCSPLDVSPDPCDPSDDNVFYIETNSSECETRICGVFLLFDEGYSCRSSNINTIPAQSPAPDPKGPIWSNNVAAAYCTCRCSSTDPGVSTCTCPEGFKCSEPLLFQGGPARSGGYCIREETLQSEEGSL